MLSKRHILSLFLNLFNKFNKILSTHIRSSITYKCYRLLIQTLSLNLDREPLTPHQGGVQDIFIFLKQAFYEPLDVCNRS